MLIDDGSPWLPDAAEIDVVGTLAELDPDSRRALLHFPDRLGRHAVADFPGWFRSFTFSVAVARKLGVEKIIHVESDAFVLSKKALGFINGLSSGWTAFWCPTYRFPETAIQIICADQFDALDQVRAARYEQSFAGRAMERALPFTRIEKTLRGDRYGETRTPIPRRADFIAQANPETILRSDFVPYRWQMMKARLRKVRRSARTLLDRSARID